MSSRVRARLVPLSAAARLSGRARTTLRAWVAAGLPSEEGADGELLIDLAELLRWRESRARAEGEAAARRALEPHIAELADAWKVANGGRAFESEDAARRRKRAAEADRAELDLAIRRGEYVPRADVRTFLLTVFRYVRQGILTWPDRAAAQVHGLEHVHEIRETLRKLAWEVLEELSETKVEAAPVMREERRRSAARSASSPGGEPSA